MPVDALLGGASLRVVLWPSEKIVPNAPPHVEGFSLPHVVIAGDAFWGKTPTVHTRGNPLTCSFCYPSTGRLLCSYTPSNGTGRVIQTARYSRREWRVADDFEEVWTLDYEHDTRRLLDAVLAGRRLKAALLSEDVIWDINPIHLPMVTEGWFLLTTPMDYYPAWFRMPGWPEKIEEAFAHQLKDDITLTTVFECDAFPSWYGLSPGGVYRGGLSEENLTYKELRIFAEVSE